MKQKQFLVASALLVCIAALGAFAQGSRTPAATLDDTAKAALIMALSGPNGEYAARAEYESILAKFGSEVLPYAHIIESENNHVAALQQQCRTFGVPIPADEFYGKVNAPETLGDAVKAGILAEEANINMYDELLSAVQGYPSLVQVFTRLQWASANRHLPALQVAQENGGSVTAVQCNPAGCLGIRRGNGCQQSGMDCIGRGGAQMRNRQGWQQPRRAGARGL